MKEQELLELIDKLKKENEALKNGNKPFREIIRRLKFRFIDGSEAIEAYNHYDREARMLNKLKSEKDFNKRKQMSDTMRIDAGNENGVFTPFEKFNVNPENGQIEIIFVSRETESNENTNRRLGRK